MALPNAAAGSHGWPWVIQIIYNKRNTINTIKIVLHWSFALLEEKGKRERDTKYLSVSMLVVCSSLETKHLITEFLFLVMIK